MISIDRILYVKKEYGSMTVGVVLDDGSSKMLTWLGGLPDDDSQARSQILARGRELFDKGIPWEETQTNIVSSEKTYRDKKPSKGSVRGMNSVPQLREAVADLIEAVEALKEQIR